MSQPENENACIRAIFRGRVQGVFFRAWTQETAESLGLSGWVRNRSNGTVEALFCGPKPKVEEMLLLAKDGPTLARVEKVETFPAGPPEEPGFHVLPTV
jgi:acylphosphatase